MKAIKIPIALFVTGLLGLVATMYFLYGRFSSKLSFQNPLALPKNASEKLVTLKGKLILKLFPGPPEYSSIEDGDRPDYCWILKLDQASFLKAITTPVAEPANTLDNLNKRSHADEILLVLEEYMENFCQRYQGQEIVSVGHLFHAHTIHHYTPILIDVKELKVCGTNK